MIKDFNVIPMLNATTLNVDYIDDNSKSFANEGPLIDFFSDKFIGVKSENYFLDFNKKTDLSNNLLFFTNTSIAFTLKIEGKFLNFENAAGQILSIIDTKKIYQCAVY